MMDLQIIATATRIDDLPNVEAIPYAKDVQRRDLNGVYTTTYYDINRRVTHKVRADLVNKVFVLSVRPDLVKLIEK